MTDIKQAVERIVANDEKWDTFIAGDKDATFETDNGPRKSLEGELEEHIRIPNNNSEANMLAAETAEAGAVAAESGAAVSAGASKADADRAVAAQGAITDELSQVQALAAQVATDKDSVTATLIGDEDYVIPAVTALLDTYTDVVDIAVSDDIWAEHSYKWGAPKRVMVVALDMKVVLHDLTKPGLPIWREHVNETIAEWERNVWRGGRTTDAIALVGGSLCIAVSLRDGTTDGASGLIVLDYASNSQRRVAANTAHGGYLGEIDFSKSLLSHSVVIVDEFVNAIAARIADDAPMHPVSGLPMPRIAVATDGGVSELVPNNEGVWLVSNWPSTGFVYGVAYTKDGRLLAKRDYEGRIYDLGGISAGVLLTSSNTTYSTEVVVKPLTGGTVISSALVAGSNGVSVLAENPSELDAGMIASVSEDYTTPFLAGDVQSAVMCDAEEGVIVGGELVIGGYAAPASYDTVVNEVSLSSFTMDGQLSDQTRATVNISTIVGQRYFVKSTLDSNDASVIMYARSLGGGTGSTLAASGSMVVDEEVILSFVAASATSSLLWVMNAAGADAAISNVSAGIETDDHSGRNNHAIIHGTLNRSKPAGSDIAVWSGFDVSNYLVIPDFNASQSGFSLTTTVQSGGTGDRELFTVGDTSSAGGAGILHAWLNGERVKLSLDGVTYNNDDIIGVLPIGDAQALSLVVRVDVFEIWVDCQKVKEIDITGKSFSAADLTIGSGFYTGTHSRDLAMVVASYSAPSPDQIRDMHRDMLNKLKKPSMLTDSVKALAHDAARGDDWVACDDGQLHRLTQRGTTFEESIVVDPGVGDISSIAVDDGEITVGGSAGVWVKQPEKNLRAPVVKSGKSVQPFELGEGDSVQTDFYLSYGWKPVRAYIGGIKKRQGSQDDWTAQYDGYRWFIRFAVAPGSFDIDCDAVEV
ncbi:MULTISPECIES: hypothetical protein [unclassified Neptuniibacter]|uniref:hypothetical protein n=1 Tax=unclassified Neptuniibacter TaxID=2630693 RepID=UPI000C657BCE|nr:MULTISPECIES: hypothetical protein [unclassified Neptuniibacter]MAY42380.1 hypothetical protein [Oceanospirillaceae bacterium]|tara:strand:- start:5748 stop:8522 length:2775 start_codon:yes stop_codon:yes gene_type:complete